MKVAIVNNWIPFVYGGAEHLADALNDQLVLHGHKSVLIKLPFRWNPPKKIIEHAAAANLLCFDNVDRIIALKYPAYTVNHPNKVVWLLHQFRQAYDLWGTSYQDLPSTPEGQKIRDMIVSSDNKTLADARKVFTISPIVSQRLKKYNSINSEVLYHPIVEPDKYHCGQFDDYIFFPSRFTRGKRQYMAIRAMKYTKTNVKLVLVGGAETIADYDFLVRTVKENSVQNKVLLMNEWISLSKKTDLFANALATMYIPYDEDSYGYVTLESFQSEKALITTNDSGGVKIFVKNGATGIITNPDPKELAAAIDSLKLNKVKAKKMGKNAKEYLESLNINWSNVVNKLIKSV